MGLFEVANHDEPDILANKQAWHLPAQREHSIYHKDRLPAVYVTGYTDSPLYGLFAISDTIEQHKQLEQWFISQPENPYSDNLK